MCHKTSPNKSSQNTPGYTTKYPKSLQHNPKKYQKALQSIPQVPHRLSKLTLKYPDSINHSLFNVITLSVKYYITGFRKKNPPDNVIT